MRVLGIVLSGGASKRFQIEGETWIDKALYPIEGKPMISYVIDKAFKVVDRLVVVVRDRERARLYERELGVETAIDDLRLSGPLAGVLGALRSNSCEKAVVLPNDMPWFDPVFLRSLLESLEQYDISSPILPNGLVMTTVMAVRCDVAFWVLEELLKFPQRSRVADLHRGAPRVALLNAKKRGVDPLSLLSVNKRELVQRASASYPEGVVEDDVYIERDFTREDVRAGNLNIVGSLWGSLTKGLYIEEFRLYVEKGAFMLAAYALLDSPSLLAKALGKTIANSLKEVS
ncbi:MAG: NTP transferase domain-containing protein [Acidilobaceae archaeon]